MPTYRDPKPKEKQDAAPISTSDSAPAAVVVILPALNEAGAIRDVLDRIPRQGLREQGYATSVWVVDGKSTDDTRDLALNGGAAVYVQRGNGKGNGMAQAFDYLVGPPVNPPVPEPARKYFVMLDSDGTYPPEAIPDFLHALRAGNDVVMGSRFRGEIETGALTPLNRIGNFALTALARFLYGIPVTDVCTGMWGFREGFLRRFASTATGFDLEADIFASACQAKERMAEVPIRYSRRIGLPKLVPLRTGLRIAWRLLLRWIRESELGLPASLPAEDSAEPSAEALS